MERDETIWQTVAREVLEETGWTVQNLSILKINTAPDQPGDDRQNVDFIFRCEAGTQTGTPDWESTAVTWYELDDLPPADQIAFDHLKSIELFRRSLTDTLDLPIIS
jgi:8-oxo-dGTP pyrophosphatase MutT (NUDIX family)